MKKRSFNLSTASLSCILMSVAVCACGQKPQFDVTAQGADVVRGHIVKQKEELGHSIVALVAQLPGGQALCTGTILTSATVLTAAHCVDDNPEKMMVIFGTAVDKTPMSHLRKADGFVQNPAWQRQSEKGRGDLAIVHFLGGLPEGYQPIQLAAKELELSEGMDVVMAGYGVTNGLTERGSGVLRETETQLIGKASPTEMISDGHRSSVCFGDSGGPSFVKTGDHYVQWGVASSVTSKACNEASVHTEVMSYEPWIRETVQKLKAKIGESDKSPTQGKKTTQKKKRN